jgi:hypothetical protein
MSWIVNFFTTHVLPFTKCSPPFSLSTSPPKVTKLHTFIPISHPESIPRSAWKRHRIRLIRDDTRSFISRDSSSVTLDSASLDPSALNPAPFRYAVTVLSVGFTWSGGLLWWWMYLFRNAIRIVIVDAYESWNMWFVDYGLGFHCARCRFAS